MKFNKPYKVSISLELAGVRMSHQEVVEAEDGLRSPGARAVKGMIPAGPLGQAAIGAGATEKEMVGDAQESQGV